MLRLLSFMNFLKSLFFNVDVDIEDPVWRGAPHDLDSAIEMLSSWLEDPRECSKMNEDDFVILAHQTIGQDLRNSWGLWHESPIEAWFNDNGIHHADDMSGIIFRSWHRVQNNRDINLESQISAKRLHWANMGFDPDNLFENKSDEDVCPRCHGHGGDPEDVERCPITGEDLQPPCRECSGDGAT